MLPALDIVIGLAAVYTAFSLLASWVNETISSITALRARTLKEGILQMVGSADLQKSLYGQPVVVAATSTKGRDPSYLTPGQFSLAITSMMNTAQIIGQTGQEAFNAVSSNVSALPPSRLRDVLSSILAESGADVASFLSRTESWFNSEMDRVSGWYKRNAQVWLFCIGMAIAIGFNVDTVTLAKAFISAPIGLDTSKLQSGTSAAEEYVSQYVFSHVTVGWYGPSYCPKTRSSVAAVPSCWDWSSDPVAILLKILGLVLTGVAISLGAPFWFDLLSRIVNVRGSGPPPQTN